MQVVFTKGMVLRFDRCLYENDESIQLSIYGHDLKEYLKECSIMDNRVIIVVVHNKEVEAQLKATLLVNPDQHMKILQIFISSKNMEYMVSGTPVLTKITRCKRYYITFS